MGENEIEIGLNKGLPHALYKRRWETRGDELMDEVSATSGLDRQAIADRVADNERFGDMLQVAAERATRVGDPYYRAVLGRVMAAATDDAKLDLADYALAEIEKLEPVHLRVLVTGYTFIDSRGQEIDAATALEQGAFSAAPIPWHSIGEWVARAGVDDPQGRIEHAIWRTLSASGLVTETQDTFPDGSIRAGLHPSSWATQTLQLLLPEIAFEEAVRWPQDATQWPE